jgi:7-cyano-7-deazaguanine synthase
MAGVVLFSGGLDSATLAAEQAASGEPADLCFVDYGQPARRGEQRSAALLSAYLAASMYEVRVAGLDVPPAGEIAARNLLLVVLALALRPEAEFIAIGIHAGTGYRDCSPAFVDVVQRVLDLHTDGACRIVTPFIHWDKADVVALALELDVPLGLTHSCEAADDACGRCRSCMDREVLLAG